MDLNNELEDKEITISEILEENSPSLEEFIKELEAKEKDLQISPGLAIEIDESDVVDTSLPDFIKAEFPVEQAKAPESLPAGRRFSEAAAFSEFEDKVLKLKKRVSKLETERAELTEIMRRRQFDFDNYKKRIERDRSETFLNQLSNLAKQMLPVLDNLNRALDFAGDDSMRRSDDFHQFFEGIILVSQQLNEVLAEMGVSPIASVGEDFDPHFHEAVATEVSGSYPPNTVTGELLRGYRIGDKVIRAAMVKVAVAGAAPPAGSSPAESPSKIEGDLPKTD